MTTVKKGSRGDAVKQLQTRLGIEADGIFGKNTEAALKAFQKANGLTVDGICGRKTWAALGVAEEDIRISCEDLKQYAAPHGTMIYGPDSSYSTYKSGGCGVVSFAIVYRALGLAAPGESSTETIQKLGKYSWQHGFRIKGGGTSAGLFNTNGCKRLSINTSKIEDVIRGGDLVILLIRGGFGNGYTGNGHYVVAYGVQGEYVLLRDVGSGAASRQKAKLKNIGTGVKGAWKVVKG